MKKVNIEATKLDNNDVIATSGVCAGANAYHLKVNSVDIATPNVGDTNESCYLYTNGNLNVSANYDTLPTDVKNSFAYHVSTSYYLQLGTPNKGDTFYWNGSSWTKCSVKHNINQPD